MPRKITIICIFILCLGVADAASIYDLELCESIPKDADRLACYDAITRRIMENGKTEPTVSKKPSVSKKPTKSKNDTDSTETWYFCGGNVAQAYREPCPKGQSQTTYPVINYPKQSDAQAAAARAKLKQYERYLAGEQNKAKQSPEQKKAAQEKCQFYLERLLLVQDHYDWAVQRNHWDIATFEFNLRQAEKNVQNTCNRRKR